MNRLPIIGFMANAGAGKDTAADHLVEAHGFIKMSLADEMKRFCRDVFQFSDDQLWGPSHFRNATDSRYDKTAAWFVAWRKLRFVGPVWCETLFDGDKDRRAWHALEAWFDGLWGAYGPPNGKGLSPRVALQTIGTEFGRAQDEQVWVRSTCDIAREVLTGCGYTREHGVAPYDCSYIKKVAGVVIPDCRFRNEVDGVHQARGFLYRLRRAGLVAGTVGVQGHASEMEQASIPDSDLDGVIDVPEGIPNFHRVIDATMQSIKEKLS